MSKKKVINRILCGIISCILIAWGVVAIRDMKFHSEYINRTAETLIDELDNQYDILFHSLETYEKDRTTLDFTVLGGNYCVGILRLSEKISLDFSVNKSFGEVRLLIVEEDNRTILYDELLEKGQKSISLNAGEYRIYLVGNWFKGNVDIRHPAGVLDVA